MNQTSDALGTQDIGKLLLKQSVPATIGMMVMSIYMLVDSIFVGQWVGVMALAAIAVVMPISFLISSFGMAVGIGAGSMISRAFGEDKPEFAQATFGNAITLSLTLAFVCMVVGLVFEPSILALFGAEENIMPFAEGYYRIILYGVPFLAFSMMANNVIRAQGEARHAMFVMIIPAVLNTGLDILFIKGFGWGLDGAAWATTISYAVSALYALSFFLGAKSEVRVKGLALHRPIVAEIASLGGVTLARQGAVSVLYIVLNQSLLRFGGEIYISAFGIINRVMMIAYAPVIGITQGFMPIAGYNHGAKHHPRVREVIRKSIGWGTAIAIIITICMLLWAEPMVRLFTNDEELLSITSGPFRMIFYATPVICFQLISSAYFQAIGKAIPALLLTLTKQIIFLIPLVMVLPLWFELDGIWMSFPIADVSSATFCFVYMAVFLKRQGRKYEID